MSEEIVLPITGELVPVTEPARVARALAELRDLKRQVESAMRECSAVLAEEGLRVGAHTLHLEGMEVTIGSDQTLVWDEPKLRELAEHGLPDERMEALLRPTVTYKVDPKVARQIERSGNPEYARIVGEARTYQPRARWVGVKFVPAGEPALERGDG